MKFDIGRIPYARRIAAKKQAICSVVHIMNMFYVLELKLGGEKKYSWLINLDSFI